MEKIPINMEISRFRRIADSCQQLCSQLPTRLLTDVSNLADKRQPLNKANILQHIILYIRLIITFARN